MFNMLFIHDQLPIYSKVLSYEAYCNLILTLNFSLFINFMKKKIMNFTQTVSKILASKIMRRLFQYQLIYAEWILSFSLLNIPSNYGKTDIICDWIAKFPHNIPMMLLEINTSREKQVRTMWQIMTKHCKHRLLYYEDFHRRRHNLIDRWGPGIMNTYMWILTI